MQRDMTLRRCLNRNTKLGDILSDCDNVGQLLDDQLETNETRRPILEKVKNMHIYTYKYAIYIF